MGWATTVLRGVLRSGLGLGLGLVASSAVLAGCIGQTTGPDSPETEHVGVAQATVEAGRGVPVAVAADSPSDGSPSPDPALGDGCSDPSPDGPEPIPWNPGQSTSQAPGTSDKTQH